MKAFLNILSRNLIGSIIAILCLIGQVQAHPFYVSNTAIKYNSSNKSIEITSKIFTDDLELALKKEFNRSIFVQGEIKNEILVYFEKHLKIDLEEKQKILVLIGYEVKEDATYIYAEIVNVKKSPKSISISNSLLIDVLQEQKNITKIDFNSKQHTLIFDLEKQQQIITN